MKNNFDACLTRVLKDEGGYSNTPGDNGGPTKYGITIHDVQLYVNKNATAKDVKALTVDQAKDIYKHKYWDSLDGDNLPSGVDYTCFDYGVNSGLGRPRKALQQFKSLSSSKLINAINDERTAFLQHLAATQEHDKQFLNGWLARVKRVRNFSLSLVNKDTTSGPVVAAGTATIFYSMSQYWHQHQMAIIIAGIATAVIVGIAVHILRNNK